ncbi:hypothetical protein GSY71_12165 [Pusillimonas sp. TS35]|uniref:hypothetical protein n=1 Tax=Paracandidimonas lactea TaxID=2895524 RepID=UPI0013683653|nr:hypothetical protein [Paracandidimonas lactea]MYN13893.1 hypothetical protein [Pusillimonas sp. TS35]
MMAFVFQTAIASSLGGDVIEIVTPGGGGYGTPEARITAEIDQDIQERVITRAQAELAYGRVIV